MNIPVKASNFNLHFFQYVYAMQFLVIGIQEWIKEESLCHLKIMLCTFWWRGQYTNNKLCSIFLILSGNVLPMTHVFLDLARNLK